MKRLKKNVVALMGCIMMCSSVAPVVEAAESIKDDSILVAEYYQAIDNEDWNSWLDLMGTKYSEQMECILENEYYIENRLGIHVIEDVVDVVSINQIDAQEYISVYDGTEGENHSAYLVGIELAVYDENEFYFDGMNYNVIIVGTVGEEREIVGVKLPLSETIAEYEGEECLVSYETMRMGGDAETYALNTCVYTANPSTIKVCRWKYGNGQIETIDFNTYVKVVMAKEFGYAGRDADYHYAGALAVKMYAMRRIKMADPNVAYHITDTWQTNSTYPVSAQEYEPNEDYTDAVKWSVVYNRVDDMWSTNMYGTGYTWMDLQYKSDEGGAGTGIMNQNTMNNDANKNMSYTNILNKYYGNSNISSGNIVFGTAGNHVGYIATDLGNNYTQYTCRCGHTWVSNESALNSLR